MVDTFTDPSIAKNLRPLELLSFEALLRTAGHHRDYSVLVPCLLNHFVKNLFASQNKDLISITPELVESLLNPNLHIFYWEFLLKCGEELRPKLWELVITRCNQLTTLDFVEDRFEDLNLKTGSLSFVDMRDLERFTKLQQLRLPGVVLQCQQIERLPDIFPRLKVLGIHVESIEQCCLLRICLLTNLERLGLDISAPKERDFYTKLWATLLRNLPNLKVLSSTALDWCRGPCLADSLVYLRSQGHAQPLKLSHLCIKWGGKRTSRLPIPLLCNVTSLCFDVDYNFYAMKLLKIFGPNLTVLRMLCLNDRLDMYKVAILCPNVEQLEIFCCACPFGGELPRSHFSKLRLLDILQYRGCVPTEFLRCAIEAPLLERFSVGFDLIDISLIQEVDRKEGVLQNLRTLDVALRIDAANVVSTAEALKRLVLAAPRLKVLSIEVPHLNEKLTLESLLEDFEGLRSLKFELKLYILTE